MNLASRIESLTKKHEAPIIISEEIREGLAGAIDTIALPASKVRGVETPLSIYRPVFSDKV